jgi:hypothetical protein
MQVTSKFQGTTVIHTSLYTWVHSEVRECISLGFSADMFAGYMQQWVSISTLKAIISRSSYNSLLGE